MEPSFQELLSAKLIDLPGAQPKPAHARSKNPSSRCYRPRDDDVLDPPLVDSPAEPLLQSSKSGSLDTYLRIPCAQGTLGARCINLWRGTQVLVRYSEPIDGVEKERAYPTEVRAARYQRAFAWSPFWARRAVGWHGQPLCCDRLCWPGIAVTTHSTFGAAADTASKIPEFPCSTHCAGPGSGG